MTNVSIRAGGMPVPSEVLVSTDGTTIQGDGSARNPLRAVGEGDPVLERVIGDDVTAATCDPTIDISIVKATNSVPAAFFPINLADGEEDGFQKTIVIEEFATVDADKFHLLCSLDGFTYISYPNTGGGAVLIWDAEAGFWRMAALAAGTPTA